MKARHLNLAGIGLLSISIKEEIVKDSFHVADDDYLKLPN
jgi:hypothetical protein